MPFPRDQRMQKTKIPARAQVYNCYDNIAGESLMLDVQNIYKASKAAKHSETIMLNAYNECFPFLTRYAPFIRSLYDRPHARSLGQLDVTVVYLRLGDLETEYESTFPAYMAFAKHVCETDLAGTKIVIVAENSKHQTVLDLKAALGPNASIKRTGRTTVQADFDMLYRAKNIIMANSTFSWWGAWLNPFKPNVYVGLNKTQPFAGHRTPWMFVNGPQQWNLVSIF